MSTKLPTDSEQIPPAPTVSAAVAAAERNIDSLGDVETFVEYAEAAYLNGHGGGEPVVPKAYMERLDRRARAVFHTVRQQRRQDNA